MSNDLISRKALIEDLMEEIPLAENTHIFKDIIENQPTAFDREKVIEELEDMKDIPHDDSVEEIISTKIWNKAIKKAIGIVEKSGLN